MNRDRLNHATHKLAKHDIMYKIKYLCYQRYFRDAFKYSRNLIRYSKYAELILIYGSLATKFNKLQLKFMNSLSIPECAYLVNQFLDVNLANLNLHDECQQFLSVVVNILVARLLVNRECSSVKLLKYLKIWIDKNLNEPHFEMSLRKFIDLADRMAPRNLFILFGTLYVYKFPIKYYLLTLKWEVLVRAITFKLNNYEGMKLKMELHENDLLAEEKRLSKLYMQLANFSAYNVAIQFEFLLTTFSLHPSTEVYNLIRERRNNIQTDWTNELFSGRIFDPVGVTIPVVMNDKIEQLGSDILTVLMAARNKLVQSYLEWPKLDANLRQLLNKEYKLNFVKHNKADANCYLTFLKLDYTQFRDLPHRWDVEVKSETTNRTDNVEDQDAQIVVDSVKVTKGDIYEFNSVLEINNSHMKDQLLPSVIIVPLRINTRKSNKTFIRIKSQIPKILNGSSNTNEVKSMKSRKLR